MPILKVLIPFLELASGHPLGFDCRVKVALHHSHTAKQVWRNCPFTIFQVGARQMELLLMKIMTKDTPQNERKNIPDETVKLKPTYRAANKVFVEKIDVGRFSE